MRNPAQGRICLRREGHGAKGAGNNGIKKTDPTGVGSVNAKEAMSDAPASGNAGALIRACRDGTALRLAAEYIVLNREGSALPNIAGFCRSLGVGLCEFDGLKKTYPDIHSALCAVFEDEALNSGVSPSVLTLYLRGRLDYGERHGAEDGGDRDGAPLKVVFEHDVLGDGG